MAVLSFKFVTVIPKYMNTKQEFFYEAPAEIMRNYTTEKNVVILKKMNWLLWQAVANFINILSEHFSLIFWHQKLQS